MSRYLFIERSVRTRRTINRNFHVLSRQSFNISVGMPYAGIPNRCDAHSLRPLRGAKSRRV